MSLRSGGEGFGPGHGCPALRCACPLALVEFLSFNGDRLNTGGRSHQKASLLNGGSNSKPYHKSAAGPVLIGGGGGQALLFSFWLLTCPSILLSPLCLHSPSRRWRKGSDLTSQPGKGGPP